MKLRTKGRAGLPNPAEDDRRFWALVTKSDGCWIWAGSANNKGYGQFHLGVGSRTVLAHRYSWSRSYGPLPPCVLHACDNPRCVRPDHLFGGTMADNQRDMAKKGRSGQRGERSPQAKLREDDIKKIFEMYRTGSSKNSIARFFSVTPSLVRGVLARRRWAHVDVPDSTSMMEDTE